MLDRYIQWSILYLQEYEYNYIALLQLSLESIRKYRVRANIYHHPSVSPLTASPAPSTSLSSPSLLALGTGLITGLARLIELRIVGLLDTLICPILPCRCIGILDVGYELVTVGEDAAELMQEVELAGTGMDIGMDRRGVPGPGVRGCEKEFMSLK